VFLKKLPLIFQYCCYQGGFPSFAQELAKGVIKLRKFIKIKIKGMQRLFSGSCLLVFRHSNHRKKLTVRFPSPFDTFWKIRVVSALKFFF
jgi:hypothetical protein